MSAQMAPAFRRAPAGRALSSVARIGDLSAEAQRAKAKATSGVDRTTAAPHVASLMRVTGYRRAKGAASARHSPRDRVSRLRSEVDATWSAHPQATAAAAAARRQIPARP
jgi:hypothetical protein